MEAMVSDAPASDIPPKVSPAAARASARGSRRARARKTSVSAPAITRSEARSSTPIEPVSERARSSTTTGAPLTV